MHQTNMMALAISIHAPPRGATKAMNMKKRFLNFNSRPSARGDHRQTPLFRRRRISIHAPPRGATGVMYRMMCICDYFNSRPSARGDQIAGTHTRRFPHFNSRPSARGDDSRTYEVKPELISIHAPPRGATRTGTYCYYRNAFQFTPLREGRRDVADTVAFRWISIHAPPRGATPRVVRRQGRRKYFNSRPSARGDDFAFIWLRERHLISIHAPPRGATYRRFLSFLALHISIHAPPRGATPPNQRHSRASCNFNSRPSARGDSLAARTRSHHVHFNSRPSARGDASVPNVLQFHIISIHAPPRGATER